MEGKESRRRPVKSGRWSKGLGRGTEGAEGEGERDEAYEVAKEPRRLFGALGDE